MGSLSQPFNYSVSAERRIIGPLWLRAEGSGGVTTSLGDRARSLQGVFGVRYAFLDFDPIELSATGDFFFGVGDYRAGLGEVAVARNSSSNFGATAGLTTDWKFHPSASIRIATRIATVSRSTFHYMSNQDGNDVEADQKVVFYGFSLQPSLQLRLYF